jgi:FlaA1/EpsC-like NDP-sugar epimerase
LRPVAKYFSLNPRTLLVVVHDVVAASVAWLLSFWLRFNLDLPQEVWWAAIQAGVWAVPAQALIFWMLGLYRGIWRYASIHDLKTIMSAVIIAALVAPLIVLLLGIQANVPRSVFLINPILLLVLMGGSRLAYRTWKEYRQYGVMHKQGEPVIILGAGDAAVNLVKELSRSDKWRIVGLLDDNREKLGRLLHGIKVLGPIEDIQLWAKKLRVVQAIIAMPSATHAIRRRAVELCAEVDVTVLTVPALSDLVSGKVTVSQVRKVEVEDLLGRESVNLDTEGLREFLSAQVVLVTGAGGSIGSELCRQIAKFEPSVVVLFELSEYALYNVSQEFSERFPDIQFECIVGDTKNPSRVNSVLRHYAPSVIFHAAAYKHVPLMEDLNAWEAIQNNVLGTYVLAKAAVENSVKKFVLISTDKAVNPTNVMGASKRLAEMVCQAYQGENVTRFAMVRFGNVLGSTGSVIPKFHEQISRGGPVTVTHPDIIRYFMSIPEAAQLVLQAGCMGLGGEIFVMDMGEPVRIVDLAQDMIRLSGFSEDEIKITYTGLRPGEKLFEELLADDEHTLPTPHPKLRVARARSADQPWLTDVIRWMKENESMDDAHVRRDLKKWIPEYSYSTRPKLTTVSQKKAF